MNLKYKSNLARASANAKKKKDIEKSKAEQATLDARETELAHITDQFKEIHEDFASMQETISKALDSDRWAELSHKNQEALVGLNNVLVKVVTGLETLAISRNDEKGDLAKSRNALASVMSGLKIPKAIKLEGNLELPKWLQSEKSLAGMTESFKMIERKLENLPKALKQGQKPEDFVPFRRVRKDGTRLVFDDTYWAAASSGGTSSAATVDRSIADGVNPSVNATVIQSTAVPGTYGLVALGPDGSTISSGASSSGKATDAYAIQAISDDSTYKYYFFEDASANYYIMRKTLATSLFKYAKGTGGYAAVYVSEVAGPSGSPTWADYGTTF
jgi:hypothetical protein